MRRLILVVSILLAACGADADLEADRLLNAASVAAACQEAFSSRPASSSEIWDGASQPAWLVEIDPGVVCFDGVITAEAAARLTDRAAPVTTLVIRSIGGEGQAGIVIGEQLIDWRTHVIVWDRCFSACAAYVFTGAARQTAPEPGVVGWHQGLAWSRFGALFSPAAAESDGVEVIARHAMRRLSETGRNDVPHDVWRSLPAAVRASLTEAQTWRLRIQRLHGYAQISEGMLSAHHLARSQVTTIDDPALSQAGYELPLFWTPDGENLRAWGFRDIVMWTPKDADRIQRLGLERMPQTLNVRMRIDPGDFPVRQSSNLPDDSADWPTNRPEG